VQTQPVVGTKIKIKTSPVEEFKTASFCAASRAVVSQKQRESYDYPLGGDASQAVMSNVRSTRPLDQRRRSSAADESTLADDVHLLQYVHSPFMRTVPLGCYVVIFEPYYHSSVNESTPPPQAQCKCHWCRNSPSVRPHVVATPWLVPRMASTSGASVKPGVVCS
jgi:hypothetical protein